MASNDDEDASDAVEAVEAADPPDAADIDCTMASRSEITRDMRALGLMWWAPTGKGICRFVLALLQNRCTINGSFDGSDAAVGLFFDNILQERTGYSLKEIMCGMTSDRAAGGVARKLGLEDRACLMHDVNKLGPSCSGGLLRRDMSKPIGPDGHRPYANPFPEGVALMRKARRMGLHYSTGSRFSLLMTLRSTSHLATNPLRHGSRYVVCLNVYYFVHYDMLLTKSTFCRFHRA